MAKRKGTTVDRRAEEAPKVAPIPMGPSKICTWHGERELITGNSKTGVLDCGHVFLLEHGFALAPPYNFIAVTMP